MFFLNLRVVEDLTIAVFVFVAACALIVFVLKRRKLLRIPAIILSSPVALLALLFIGAQVLSLGCMSNSAPLFSPGHDKLIRVVTDDEGALGGSSAVELLTHHGFGSTYIYRGGYGSVDVAKDVRWIDDRRVAIQYEPYQFLDCTSTRTVTVQCSVKMPLIPTGMLPSPDGNAVAEFHTAKDGTYEGTDAVILTGKVGYAFVYVGAPSSVVWEQTRWLSGRELQITTKADPRACADQIGITVTCLPYLGK